MGVEGAEQTIGDRTRQWLHSDNRLNLTGSITTGVLMTCQDQKSYHKIISHIVKKEWQNSHVNI